MNKNPFFADFIAIDMKNEKYSNNFLSFQPPKLATDPQFRYN